ncbi:MAG TPA: helix-turn-helix transcriptional regulator [Planctomycetota bacterium]|nr:helix-turn-helix transcriptional regulator [Planctomycetota bacterium]
MSRDFGDLLRQLIMSTNASVSTWAQRVGLTHGQIHNIIAGRRSPPLDQLERWCDELGLVDEVRARFLQLARLAHAPSEVRELVEKLEAQVETLVRDNATLRQHNDLAREQLKRLRRIEAIANARQPPPAGDADAAPHTTAAANG